MSVQTDHRRTARRDAQAFRRIAHKQAGITAGDTADYWRTREAHLVTFLAR